MVDECHRVGITGWCGNTCPVFLRGECEEPQDIEDPNGIYEEASMPALNNVIALAHTHRNMWRDKPESYWYYRLVEEVGELGSSLAQRHKDPPEVELEQIAAICINWLRLRQEGKRVQK